MPTPQVIPMLHARSIGMIMDMLNDAGVPLTSGMSVARMPTRIIDNRSGYLPFKIACDWVAYEAQSQQIDNLCLRAAIRTDTQLVPQKTRDIILSSATLNEGLRRWASLVRMESSNVNIALLNQPNSLRLCFSSTYEQHVPGQVDFIYYSLALHMAVIRLFLGPTWCPKQMFVPFFGRQSILAQELWPNTRLIRNAKFTGIDIAREHLLTPPKVLLDETQTVAMLESDPFPSANLANSLEKFVRLYLPDGAPKIEHAAEAAGMSVRSLQRDLKVSGLTYHKIIDNCRFDAAKEMLEQGDISTKEVARQVGYKNLPHFSRAFYRLAGITPTEYKKTIRDKS
jgi:AraC-like DNA-binding protein